MEDIKGILEQMEQDLTRAINKLSDSVEKNAEKTNDLAVNVAVMAESFLGHKEKTEVILNNMIDRIARNEKKTSDLYPRVEKQENITSKGLGIIGFIAFLFGTLGANIGKVFALFH